MEKIDSYKWCIVPNCINTSIKTPEKVFVRVPRNAKQRVLWIKAVRREQSAFSDKNTFLFVCEDHFNVSNLQ